MRRIWLFVFAAALAACGAESASDVARLEIEPGSTIVVGIGGSAEFRAMAFDSSGRMVSAREAAWRSADQNVASVESSGLATGVGAGLTMIIAELAGVADTAAFEVWVPPTVQVYEPGTSYFGRNGYVEYIPGTLPLVLSAPHGGVLTPVEIPDRTWGTVVTDSYTVETIHAVREALLEQTGEAPHVVISHLKRTKLDPNREIEEAAQENPYAELAWEEFHGFIEVAAQRLEADLGRGLYLDLHGHGHAIPRLELGYLLSASDLNRTDADLNDASFALESSVAALAQTSPLPFSALVRGQTSFGAYLAEQGIRSVPSPDDPSPGSHDYFSGGYNTVRHGSRNGGTVSGLQIEMHRTGIRDTDEHRRVFGRGLAEAVERFMLQHYGFFRTGG